MSKVLMLHQSDNIVVATERLGRGEDPLAIQAPLVERISEGHKISLVSLAKGTPIIKFGQVIGFASKEIAAGEHVHSHNCSFGEHERDYKVGVDLEAARAAIPMVSARQFMGYRRKNGDVGTRNMIALCSTVNCSATVVRQAAMELEISGVLDAYPNVDGVIALSHGSGCGMASSGPGWENLQRVLWGHATHPNVGATVFVGLGCEVMQISRMRLMFDGDGREPFHGLTIQQNGGTKATVEKILETVLTLLPQVNEVERTACPISALKIGLQCGGSDGFSGITANPSLGAASDILVGHGSTVILSETPEIYGAEQLLLRRAASTEIAEKLEKHIEWWENYTRINDGSMDNNPSPGNKAGGLTTILEKSLGAAAKAGATPLNAVYAYGEKVAAKGFVFMDTPGYDPVSVTGQIAGGAQLIVFTTGRGSAFGSKPAPTLKLATNDSLFKSMEDDMDINCGDVVSKSVTLSEKAESIVEAILDAASGKKTKSELLGLGDNEFIPWQIGAVM